MQNMQKNTQKLPKEVRKFLQDAILKVRANAKTYSCLDDTYRKATYAEVIDDSAAFARAFEEHVDARVNYGAYQVALQNPWNPDQYIKIVRSPEYVCSKDTDYLMELGMNHWEELPVVRCFCMDKVLGHDVYIVEKCDYTWTDVSDEDWDVVESMVETLEEFTGMQVNDTHGQNIMQTKDGRWVIIDCMFTEYMFSS